MIDNQYDLFQRLPNRESVNDSYLYQKSLETSRMVFRYAVEQYIANEYDPDRICVLTKLIHEWARGSRAISECVRRDIEITRPKPTEKDLHISEMEDKHNG